MYLLIYRREKKGIVFKIVKHIPPFIKINDTNSYGWVLLDVQKFYKGRFQSISETENARKLKVKVRFSLKGKLNEKARLKRENALLKEEIYSLQNRRKWH